jgi:hypothetical protein
MLSFVAQDQTNISADSLGVSINKPFREVLGSAALYICVLDRLHVGFWSTGVWKEAVVGSENAQPLAEYENLRFQFQTTDLFDRAACIRFSAGHKLSGRI